MSSESLNFFKWLRNIFVTRGTSFSVISLNCDVSKIRCACSLALENPTRFNFLTFMSLCQYFTLVMGVGNFFTTVYTACQISCKFIHRVISFISKGAKYAFLFFLETHKNLFETFLQFYHLCERLMVHLI